MTHHPTISVVINTLNEAEAIERCLEGAAWADEIVVVDMKSDDNTTVLAKKHGARVFSHERMGIVEPARNFAISKAKSEWIMVVDADEVVPAELARLVKETIASPQANAYEIATKNMVFGEWIQHGTLWPDYHVRLFKKGYLEWPTAVHDAPKLADPALRFDAKEDLALHHFSRSYSSVSNFIETYMLRYSVHEVKGMHERQEYSFKRRHLLIMPWREFKLRFITAKGYRDGYIGLVLAMLFASYRAIAVIRYWDVYQPKNMRDKKSNLVTYLWKLYTDR